MKSVQQEVTQRVDMSVAAHEAEDYEMLRARLARAERRNSDLMRLVTTERAVRATLESEIRQYQAMLESALVELSIEMRHV